MSPPPELEPGLYRHYKGDLYLVLAVAETHEHDGCFDVVYLSLTYGAWRTRPLFRDRRNQDSWCDLLEWPDGRVRTRFTLDTPALAAATLHALSEKAKQPPPTS